MALEIEILALPPAAPEDSGLLITCSGAGRLVLSHAPIVDAKTAQALIEQIDLVKSALDLVRQTAEVKCNKGGKK